MKRVCAVLLIGILILLIAIEIALLIYKTHKESSVTTETISTVLSTELISSSEAPSIRTSTTESTTMQKYPTNTTSTTDRTTSTIESTTHKHPTSTIQSSSSKATSSNSTNRTTTMPSTQSEAPSTYTSTTEFTTQKYTTSTIQSSSSKATSSDSTDRTTTMPSTQSEAPSIRTSTTESTTQKYPTNTIQSSSSEATSSDSTDATETTTNAPTITPTSKIPETVPSTISIVTTETTSPITVEIDTTVSDTTITATNCTESVTTTSETTVTEKSSTISSTTTTAPTSPPTDCDTICIIGNKNINITAAVVTRSTKEDTTMHYIKIPEFNYVVKDTKTGIACVLTNMRIRINLQYVTNDSQIGKATLTIPVNAKTTGICGKNIAEMTLRWRESAEDQVDGDDKENRITFHYAHDDTRFFLDSISVDVHLDGKNFPHAQQKRMNGETADRRLQLFSASLKDGMFICKVDNTTVNVGNKIDVVISDIHSIAFNECVQNCSRTDDGDNVTVVTSKIVNIGVIIGAIIIGIILILNLIYFILYLIWRTRSKNLARSQDPANSAYRRKGVITRWHV